MPDREELERVANIQPTRLERRLARNELKMLDAAEVSDKAGFGVAGRILLGFLSVLGVVAAMIPTLLYFAVIMIPLFLMYSCLSHF